MLLGQAVVPGAGSRAGPGRGMVAGKGWYLGPIHSTQRTGQGFVCVWGGVSVQELLGHGRPTWPVLSVDGVLRWPSTATCRVSRRLCVLAALPAITSAPALSLSPTSPSTGRTAPSSSSEETRMGVGGGSQADQGVLAGWGPEASGRE